MLAKQAPAVPQGHIGSGASTLLVPPSLLMGVYLNQRLECGRLNGIRLDRHGSQSQDGVPNLQNFGGARTDGKCSCRATE